MLNTQFIENIKKANNDNSLAIFVGAGISMSSNTKNLKLPSWNDLIEQLQVELGEDETDYLKLAQLYYLAFGEFSYIKKIKSFFPDYIKPSEIHKHIFEINPHIIITTNWDNILERAVEENAYIYDIICSDKDLVKSSIQNKIIKMHGDFRNHNIVFKEDDYLDYSQHFPLTENFIKSIISTHTVLFLGYSYNDINLKHILKWVQTHSEVRPPMYLTTFKENRAQSEYLRNHGITTIVLEENNFKNMFSDIYSQKIFTFLNRLKNGNEIHVLASEEETIKFLYNKLKHLDTLNSILLDQIKEALTNCEIVFDGDSKPVLEFLTTKISFNENKDLRAVYKKFVEIIDSARYKEEPSKELLKFYSILNKANIKGIVTEVDNKTYYDFRESLGFNEEFDLEVYLNFNYKNIERNVNQIDSQMNSAFKEYQKENFEDSYKLLEEIISYCLKQRRYTDLFIAMFNRNLLLRFLKYGLFSRPKGYKETEEYNLKEKYLNLPKDLRKTLEPIYNFIDHSFIYKNAYKISEEINKKEDSKRVIQSGGIVFNSDVTEFESKQNNLIQFVLKNRIMIESYTEFRNINKGYIQISLLRQIQKKEISLNKIELFASIKYIKNKDLKYILKEFYNADSDTTAAFKIEKENLEWILNIVFENVIELYLYTKSRSNKFEQYLENILFLTSLTKLSSKQVEKVLFYIKKIISEAKNTLGILQSVNLFLGIQNKLYQTIIPENFLIEVLEELINKIIYRRMNGHLHMALTRNDLYNIYGYAINQKANFTNVTLIEKLLVELKDYECNEKIDIAQGLLINIYSIADVEIKEMLKKFLLSINSNKEEDKYRRVSFELFLVIHEFKKITSTTKKHLAEYVEKFSGGKTFSTGLYHILNQVEYLIKNKHLKGLDKVLKQIEAIISIHEKQNQLSIL